ncbi:ferredoxin [Mycolicibacterium chitae]|uniref:Ferredoxin n=1 Tax=Mycolicibacterium chitae TaxID=1792 RepID=A0A3S4TNV7_MYCCI|nr:PDR/VanB family oxidoreductase [Mycolicibacterium chitae]MCV7105039.1 oxidoreductase [Mycolicibacterium chitae]BBZ05681.1 ferredoxin [Mycolicibacterium chitae]VEG49292.1 ferredoxin [Mycolicibacterium chitae]
MGETEMDTTIARREELSDGVVRITLKRGDDRRFPTWLPGAHVDLVLEADLVRQYSLCSDPEDRSTLEVAVLREPCSRGGSAYVHDKLLPGDSVRIRGPRNHFPLIDAAEYLFIAGGIGITPILPMVRGIAQSEKPWRLFYGGRSRTSMPFLADLIDRHGDHVDIRAQDEAGLLDLDTALGAPREGVAIYCCGPEGLLKAVEERCRLWPPGALHVERFAPKVADPAARAASFQLELARSGQTLTVPANRTIVDVMDEAGITVPVSCREGTCGTCETAVLAGAPDHRDSILTEDERAANDVMFVCVSRSNTDVLRIDR